MLCKKAPKNITIIDISGHTPKRKQILILGEPEELEEPKYKVIIFGSIIPLLIIYYLLLLI